MIGQMDTLIAAFTPKQCITPVPSTQQEFVPASSQDGRQWFNTDHFSTNASTSVVPQQQPMFGGCFVVHQNLEASACGFEGSTQTVDPNETTKPVLYVQDTIRLTCKFRGNRTYLQTIPPDEEENK